MHCALDNPGIGTYYLRLRTYRGSEIHTDTKLFAVEKQQNNWPGPTLGHIRSGAIVMDIDEDGKNEIVQSTYGDGVAGGFTYVWNDDGSLLPGWPQALNGDPSCSTSAVGDVDGDGDFEVITTTYGGGHIYVWDWQNGQSLAGWPKNLGSFIRANPVLVDIDQDGDAEIVVAVAGYNNSNYGINAYEHDGTLLWNTTIDNVQAPMAAADIDKDGDVEIVVQAQQYTYLLDRSGEILKKWSGGSFLGAAIADLDNDNSLEIVTAGMYYIRALAYDGAIKWSQSHWLYTYYGTLAIGDLDSDGEQEICITDGSPYTTGDKMAVFDYKGGRLFTKNTYGTTLQNAPTIGDIDNDGQKEVLVSSGEGLLFAWNKWGDLKNSFPRTISDDNGTFAPVTLADLDLDGDLDFIIGGSPSHYNFSAKMYVIDYIGNNSYGAIDWGMYRRDPQCSGLALPMPHFSKAPEPEKIQAGKTVKFNVQVYSPGDMPIYLYCRQAPSGATFDTSPISDGMNGLFTWTPDQSQVGTYKFYFFATDGVRQVHYPTEIIVVD